MPMKPTKICIEPNCGRPAAAGDCRCPEHARAHAKAYGTSPHRVERATMYNSRAWAALRREVLMEQPFCAVCLAEGRYTPAQVVDHITPHRGDARMFFDKGNLQPLCKRCHDIKTAKEDGGFGH